jgi:hypothetical protein
MKNPPGEPGEQPDYLSYLMRLWRVHNGEKITWRASLESALTGETHNFASLNCLCNFLRGQTGLTSDSGDPSRRAQAREKLTGLQPKKGEKR